MAEEKKLVHIYLDKEEWLALSGLAAYGLTSIKCDIGVLLVERDNVVRILQDLGSDRWNALSSRIASLGVAAWPEVGPGRTYDNTAVKESNEHP